MLPIMIIDELARPVTLAMRLFGNIFAGEVLLLVVAAVIAAHLGACRSRRPACRSWSTHSI